MAFTTENITLLSYLAEYQSLLKFIHGSSAKNNIKTLLGKLIIFVFESNNFL